MSYSSRLRLGCLLVLLPLAVGCGGTAADSKLNLDKQASGKAAAMKELADALSRNAPAGEVNGIAETFVTNNLDVKAHPDEAKQIVEIYNAKVKGKLKGEQAGPIKAIIEGIEKELKQ